MKTKDRQYLELLPLLGALACMTVPGIASAQSDDQDDDDGYALEEIVVTAEKFESTAQETARAISVFDSEELDATASLNLDTVLRNVPGINVQGGFQQLYVRGIGSNSDPGLGESSVAINIDGANQFSGSGTGVLNALFDVERIEVMRGPSGAIQGRNAIGGVVNIVSRKPVLGEFSGNASVGMGNYNSEKYELGLNIPVSDTFAFRVAGLYQQHDGYIHATAETDPPAFPPGQSGVSLTAPYANSEDVFAGRIRALWQPTDDVSMILTYSQLRDKSNRSTGVPNLASHPDDPWLGDPAAAGPAAGANETNTLHGELTWDFDWATLTGTIADTTIELVCDTSVTPVCPADQEQTSYELRLNSSPESDIEWMVGAYRFESAPFNPAATLSTDLNTALPQGDLLRPNTVATSVEFEVNQIPVPTESDALYAYVKYPFTDRIRGSVSVRYTEDNKSNEYILYAVQGPGGDMFNATFDSDNLCDNCVVVAQNAPFLASTNDEPFTWTVGLEYDLNDSSMLYASVNTGFKAGGVSPVIVPPRLYDSEELVAWTFGSKNRFMDDRLQVNLEAYYYKYDGFQINFANESEITRNVGGQDYTDPNEFQSITYNADEGTMKGLEVEVDWLASRDDRFRAAISYSSGEYGALLAPLGGPPWLPPEYEITGGEMAQNPEWRANFGYEHIFHVLGGELVPRLDIRYSDDYYTTAETYLPLFPDFIFGVIDIVQESFWKYDAYMNYTPDDGNFSLNFYIKNIENTAELTFQTPGGTAVTNPRTYGVSISTSF